MTNLIQKLEAAGEGSRELDAAIALATGWITFELPDFGRRWQRWHGTIVHSCPPYCTSIDAAMSLVPEGCNTALAMQDRHSLRWKWEIRDRRAVRHKAQAATPALALCIAALKAREAGEEG